MVFKSDQIHPKSKAILPFLPKINGFQSLAIFTDQIHPKSSYRLAIFTKKSIKSDQIDPKSKAIDLPFLPKIDGFQK